MISKENDCKYNEYDDHDDVIPKVNEPRKIVQVFLECFFHKG